VLSRRSLTAPLNAPHAEAQLRSVSTTQRQVQQRDICAGVGGGAVAVHVAAVGVGRAVDEGAEQPGHLGRVAPPLPRRSTMSPRSLAVPTSSGCSPACDVCVPLDALGETAAGRSRTPLSGSGPADRCHTRRDLALRFRAAELRRASAR
jgi:hypothetical protein